MTALAILACVLAALPVLVYLRNRGQFDVLPPFDPSRPVVPVSVLIPARNEEASIAGSIQSIRASLGVELEIIVLDDHSTDATAEIVRAIAAVDPRIRLEAAPLLPEGWSGKQHACFTLAQRATHERITFLDADVRLESTALARMSAFLDSSGAALVSGFPRQVTETWLEKLVIPLMPWLIVGYLPLIQMRKSLQPGLGAGCGQWFMTTRTAYRQVGGHGHPLVRSSFHDGVKLPRAYRRSGLKTDLTDASAVAHCRMYRSASQVWFGLAKNAGEGLGGAVSIWIWTLLLGGGHVLPMLLAVATLPSLSFAWLQRAIGGVLTWILLANVLSLMPRFAVARATNSSLLTVPFHSVGVAVLMAIQWYAWGCRLLGRPVAWKGRPQPQSVTGKSHQIQ